VRANDDTNGNSVRIYIAKTIPLHALSCERRNSPNRSVISPNSVAFGAVYVKVVEDKLTPILSAAEMQTKKF